jgi:hypothetical protein
MFDGSGENVAIIGFNESCSVWQIAVVQREEIEFFCPQQRLLHSPRSTMSLTRKPGSRSTMTRPDGLGNGEPVPALGYLIEHFRDSR